MIGKYTLHVL